MPHAPRRPGSAPRAFAVVLGICAFLAFWQLPAIAQEAPLVSALRAQIDAAAVEVIEEEDAADLALLMRFYAEREGRPLWVTPEGATEAAFSAAGILKAADREGLDPDDYGAAAIQPLLASSLPGLLAQLEWRLSLGVIQYAADLNGGRLEPREVDPELFVYPRALDKAALLQELAVESDVAALLSGLAPEDSAYAEMREALAVYRERARSEEPPPVAEGETLDPGMRDPRVAALRARLLYVGDMTTAGQALGEGDLSLFDPSLEMAVKRFQARHGLEPDGRVGKNTLAAVNVSLGARVQQILLNLERLRWIAGPRPERYLEVNLADFTLHIYENGEEVFFSRVVVGDPFNRTPVFRRDMTYLVLNPYWNVPPSIATKELLPKIKQDPAYLTERNYELLSGWSEGASLVDPRGVDWSQVSARSFPYKVRQKPGEGNALGRVKFMLPNEFSIYLHDTPAKNLFARSQRTFSHGCIRVARPMDLAAFLLQEDEGWTPESIQAAVDSGEQRVVSLLRPMPVVIDYRTAWVDAEGRVQFRSDVYERDRRLAAALLGPRSTAEAMPQ